MEEKKHSEITFLSGEDKPWIMKLTRTAENDCKVLFNTKDYPNCLPDDFAHAVAEILCATGYIELLYIHKGAEPPKE